MKIKKKSTAYSTGSLPLLCKEGREKRFFFWKIGIINKLLWCLVRKSFEKWNRIFGFFPIRNNQGALIGLRPTQRNNLFIIFPCGMCWLIVGFLFVFFFFFFFKWRGGRLRLDFVLLSFGSVFLGLENSTPLNSRARKRPKFTMTCAWVTLSKKKKKENKEPRAVKKE